MKKPNLPKSEKPAEDKPPTAGSNTMDLEMRALFLANKDKYAKAVDKQKKAAADVRSIAKTIKADGFTLRQIKLAIQLDDPEGEAAFKALVANDLLAAQYAGAAIGSQLQLFLEPDRTPAVDRAYDEGQRCSMENRQAISPYDPSTPQHQQFMNGFHDHQAQILKAGIKPLVSEMN